MWNVARKPPYPVTCSGKRESSSWQVHLSEKAAYNAIGTMMNATQTCGAVLYDDDDDNDAECHTDVWGGAV